MTETNLANLCVMAVLGFNGIMQNGDQFSWQAKQWYADGMEVIRGFAVQEGEGDLSEMLKKRIAEIRALTEIKPNEV